MAIEPAKISELTQEQRNALIVSLGCKTIHRMNNGDSLPVGFEPDELIIDTGAITTDISISTGTPIVISVPNIYFPTAIIATTESDDTVSAVNLKDFGGTVIIEGSGEFNAANIYRVGTIGISIAGFSYNENVLTPGNFSLTATHNGSINSRFKITFSKIS